MHSVADFLTTSVSEDQAKHARNQRAAAGDHGHISHERINLRLRFGIRVFPTRFFTLDEDLRNGHRSALPSRASHIGTEMIGFTRGRLTQALLGIRYGAVQTWQFIDPLDRFISK